MDFFFTVADVFEIPSAFELTEINGQVINESDFCNLVNQVNEKVANLRVKRDFDFAVPLPFETYRKNLGNQIATPVFRQNCFIIDTPTLKPLKALHSFAKKPTPKRLTKGRPFRI